MKKILFIVNDNRYTTKILNEAMVDIDYTYSEIHSIVIRFVRRLWAVFNMPFYSFWFKFKKRKIEHYDMIVLYDCRYPEKIIKYIRKRNKLGRIIYWLWNSIEVTEAVKKNKGYSQEKHNLNLIRKRNIYNCEIWSFDRNDCKKYNLYYNNQVAYKIDRIQQDIKYDFFFSGKDKERLKIIEELKGKLKNYKWKILILPDKGKKYNEEEKTYILSNILPYSKIINYVNKSKCIVDIVQKEQGGLTWRPLEAMFYKKKLITNFEKIVEYDFYNPKNIFILGKDNIDNIKEFINSKYEDVPEKIINKYTINGWLNNFINFK